MADGIAQQANAVMLRCDAGKGSHVITLCATHAAARWVAVYLPPHRVSGLPRNSPFLITPAVLAIWPDPARRLRKHVQALVSNSSNNLLMTDCFFARLTVARLTVATAGLILATAATAFGQSDPSEFTTEFPRMGIEVGLPIVSQSGTYAVGCGVFDEGSDIGLFLAGAYDYPLTRREGFRLEGLAGFQLRTLNSSYDSAEATVIRTGANQFITRDVTYSNLGDATFIQFSILPSVKFTTKSFYVGAGLGLNLTFSASTSYSKQIVTKVVFDNAGNATEVFYPQGETDDIYTKEYPSEDPDNVAAVAFDGMVYAGYEFTIYKRLKVGPRLAYMLPLTATITDPELKLSSLVGTLGVRYSLQ